MSQCLKRRYNMGYNYDIFITQFFLCRCYLHIVWFLLIRDQIERGESYNRALVQFFRRGNEIDIN